MSSPYVPSAAGLRYRRGWSSVFRSRKDQLPLPPRPKDVDGYHAKLYIKTGKQNRPDARRELHANYAHEVAKRMEMADAQYLEHLADDSATHWVRGQPEESADEELKRFRGVLNQDYCALFRPRLDAFFDMRLPMDEDKRNGEDKVLSESEYSLFVEERHQRIKYIESAVAVAWCRFQLEDLQHRMKLNTDYCDTIWRLHKKLRQPKDVADVAKAARGFLECERELDYCLLLEAHFKERITRLEQTHSLQWPLNQAKMAYKDSKKQSADADKAVAARTRGGSEQPESAHLRTKVQETGFWVAWALSNPASTHSYGDNWLEELAKFLKKARTQGLLEARPTLSLLNEYSALKPFFEGRKAEVGDWVLRPRRSLSQISITGGPDMGTLFEPGNGDNLSGTTPTAPSARRSASTSSSTPHGAVS
ncbi:hypothetical protein B0A53_05866 [Rhodotorula sp. CCFEE 5036]|nr:hypothetical protein B0A53_05866 [Rhodotorula sp. CCFEE 5036]